MINPHRTHTALDWLLIGMFFITACSGQASTQVNSSPIVPTSTHLAVQITHTRTPDPSPNPQNTSTIPASSTQAYDWLQFNGDAQHSGKVVGHTDTMMRSAAGARRRTGYTHGTATNQSRER